jgi:hypothetical protein
MSQDALCFLHEDEKQYVEQWLPPLKLHVELGIIFTLHIDTDPLMTNLITVE